MLTLEPDGSWNDEFRELRRDDVRGPGKDTDDMALDEVLGTVLGNDIINSKKKKSKKTLTSNGRFEESWIWLVQRKGRAGKSEEDEFGDDMRVEWAKSRARMMRWQEEFQLIQEEMRRVVVWYEWKAGWWERKASERIEGESEILSGVVAYSHKQAYILRTMAQRCAETWIPLLKTKGIVPDWASRYSLPTSSGRKKRAAGEAKGKAREEAHNDGNGDGDLTESDNESTDEVSDLSDGDGEGDEDEDDYVYAD